MKKSNWLIVGLFVVASVIFLAMWYVMGFNLIDDPLDLVISIVWWVVIIAICLLIQWSENKAPAFYSHYPACSWSSVQS